MPYPSVADAILDQLRLWGVKRIYGFVGDSVFGLMDAIAKQTAIRFISVKHESAAAFMASAEAKYTGNLAVCIAHMGPGLSNLLNGLGDAAMDGYPVLAITGQAPLEKIGTMYKQYINQQEFVRALAGHTQLVVHPDAVIDALTTAIQHSITAGMVSHLSIPADLFTMPTRTRIRHPNRQEIVRPDSASIEQALRVMRAAKRPLILAGDKARAASTDIVRLAKKWGCGIAHAYGAAGIIPDDFPLLLGGLGEGGNPHLDGLFKQTDAVLAIGTSWRPNEETPANAVIIRVVGRQSEIGIGMPAQYVITGDAAAIVNLLEQGIQAQEIHPDWNGQMRQCKQVWDHENEAEGNRPGVPLHPSRVVRALEKHVSSHALIALDEGDSTLWFLRNFRARSQQILFSGRWRSMGFGLPAALAAKCCDPRKQVVCVTGDGGLAMVMADLLTAVRYGLPIVVVVFNNGTLQMERNKMEAKGLIPEATEIRNPDFVKLAEACGWQGYRVISEEKLDDLLQVALNSVQPVLLDVPIAQAAYPEYPKA